MPTANDNRYTALERWLLSPEGKRTLNRFYSWGAAFVILGALFKFLAWPYANVILFFSMMTEVLVFFISGFEPQTEGEEVASSLPQDVQNHTHTQRADDSQLNLVNEHYRQEMEELSERVQALKHEHERMVQNLAELNQVYRRMLEAMQRQDRKSVD